MNTVPARSLHAGTALPCVMISAAHRSSGKTTLALGLCAALHARGLAVQAFKKGPDYIDPMWLNRASRRPCYNLDPYLMPMAAVRNLFAVKAQGADLALVEGNQSLHDGLALDGSNSNAALAKALGLPVVLVIDVRGMNRGIAPLILGYQAFDRDVRIGGVILNRVGSARHEAKLRAVLEAYTDVPVVGAVREAASISILERHLGLVPANEALDVEQQIARIGASVASQVDLELLLRIGADAGAAGIARVRSCRAVPGAGPADAVRIGIAMDRAFGFYYADDLEALRQAGAQLLAVDTLRDRCLPPVDALLIGGGFPENCAAELEANVAMRSAVAAAVRDDLPVYAECGGLMYLARSLTVDGRRFSMVGAIDGDVTMEGRPVGMGYVELTPTGCAPFPVRPATDSGVPAGTRAHEFHYSRLSGLPPESRFAYRVIRGHGINGTHDGVVVRNLLASYSHLRSLAGTDWAHHFVDFAARTRQARRCGEAPASSHTTGTTAPCLN